MPQHFTAGPQQTSLRGQRFGPESGFMGGLLGALGPREASAKVIPEDFITVQAVEEIERQGGVAKMTLDAVDKLSTDVRAVGRGPAFNKAVQKRFPGASEEKLQRVKKGILGQLQKSTSEIAINPNFITSGYTGGQVLGHELGHVLINSVPGFKDKLRKQRVDVEKFVDFLGGRRSVPQWAKKLVEDLFSQAEARLKKQSK